MSDRPPAGGFGAASRGSSSAFGVISPPPKPLGRWARAATVVAVGLGVGFLVAFVVSARLHGLKHQRMHRAEAINTVADISKHVQRSYEETGDLCPSAMPIPADFSKVQGQKYMALNHLYADDAGWSCLGYEFQGIQRYQLHYERIGDLFFTITAVGDLDGNDVRSTYTIEGHVDPETKQVFFAPLQTSNPDE
jgi:hypothetical protein